MALVMPSWDQCMVPVLRVLGDGASRQRRDLFELPADDVGLTPDQRLEGGAAGEPKYQNRVGWALSYLDRVGAIERPSRGVYRITPLGTDLASQFPSGITERELRAFAREGDTWWLTKPSVTPQVPGTPPTPDVAPEASVLDPYEQIETGVARIDSDVASELLVRLHAQ